MEPSHSPDVPVEDPYRNVARSTELGKLVEEAVVALDKLGWKHFIASRRGKSCLHPNIRNLPHPAASYLERLRTVGAPAQCDTAPWTQTKNDEAVARGCHQSAKHYQGFLEEEMVDMISKNYCVVLPYKNVRHMENLRVSPIGVVPQRERRPRPIVDYSFFGTNDETKRLAPREAMQFGRALDRLLEAVHTAEDKYGPVYLLKIDISDGFYRIMLKDDDIPMLGVVLPYQQGEEPLIAFFLVLPMGWTESPPTFCTTTETVVDLTNQYLGRWDPPPHPLEKMASEPPIPPDDREISYAPTPQHPDSTARRLESLPPLPTQQARNHRRPKRRLQYTDVYVDDEILLGQGTPAQLNRMRRTLLHINDLVFRPNDATDDSHGRREPISTKKLQKGDACLTTCHVVLGWIIDTMRKTIELPAHRKERLHKLLLEVKGRKRCTEKTMHKLLGELRSMAQGIPGCRGLFSQLQHALATRSGHRVKLNEAAQDHISDFETLAQDVTSRPTRLAEIVPSVPHHYGTCDAAKSGFGGCLLPNSDEDVPLAWRTPCPRDIQTQICSWENPRGSVTNSDLELAGTLLQEDVVANHRPCAESTIATGCDNTPAVAWRNKGSTTTGGPAAYLLREASLFQRRNRFQSTVFHVPGPTVATRSAKRGDVYESALRIAKTTARRAVNPQRAAAQLSVWQKSWLPFCQAARLDDPLLRDVVDPVETFEAFSVCLRTGQYSRSGRPISAKHVRDETAQVAKTFTDMGHDDPRFNRFGVIDKRLSNLWKALGNDDPAPYRVKPMPLQVLHHAQSLVNGDDKEQAILDAGYIGFYYLLRTGEHLITPKSKPLLLRNVTFQTTTDPACDTAVQAVTATSASLVAAQFSSLTFDDQKNRERGETIAHGSTGHHFACPTAALKRRVLHLRQHGAHPNTPLCSYFDAITETWTPITTSMLNRRLRRSVRALPGLSYSEKDVSARSLRSGGAMALLLSGVSKDVIQLVGRWRSDAMFRYLHQSALPLVGPLAAKMLQNGTYTLIPGGLTPAQGEAIISSVPISEADEDKYLLLSPFEDEDDEVPD